EAWDAIGACTGFGSVVADAGKLLSEPVPELPDDLFLDFSRTGNRTRYQRVHGQRRSRLRTLVLAECVENKRQFVPAIEEVIRATCAERTWVLPAHDGGLENFEGKAVYIDLSALSTGWELATAAYWLGGALSEETRRLVRGELERRIFEPFAKAARHGPTGGMWWMERTNNWNAVCLAAVTGAALAAVEARDARAFVLGATELSIRNFLRGFTGDGYCSEGLGYWNYGFGNFVYLAETVLQATGGGLDLMAHGNIRNIALFAPRMEILPGVYPAIADCSPGTKPSGQTMGYLSRRLGLGFTEWERSIEVGNAAPGLLYTVGVFAFPNSANAVPVAEDAAATHSKRDWFQEAGVLVCRPDPKGTSRLGVALKGGHNNEHHNHNDVGTYVVAVGRETPLTDIGAVVYTAKTFSRHRYESNVMNSFGHPVPVVAGSLQSTGADARAQILKTDFGDARDTVAMDMRSAYDVPGMKRLERTFVYDREGAGGLVVTDEVEFAEPCSFGTALVTNGEWRREEDGSLVVTDEKESVRVEIDTGGEPYEIHPERIEADLRSKRKPLRLGIDLTRAVESARIEVRIAPVQ
ncbi:MAG: heparinase, partial [Planctomycetota bacterium]